MSSAAKMMDFDNVLDIASQNQGVSNVQVGLSFTHGFLKLNETRMDALISCDLQVLI